MKEHETTGTADQRRTGRKSLDSSVSMRLTTDSLVGHGDNISRAGLLFYSDQPLRVEVQIDENGQSRTYHGRLIRLQRISDSSTGLAVEFDPE